ncbi:MAG: hypothetical protein M1827_004814 [Pycnora praestabilis]|nr:MAG: hypothetical protein M1827_004814 [Pycnora praestabilis]
MSFKLSELLNPAPSSGQSTPTPADHISPQQSPYDLNAPASHHERREGTSHSVPVTNAYDAADALTASASSGSSPQQERSALNHDTNDSSVVHSHGHNHAASTRRMSYGSVVTPMEPSPSLERTQKSFSPSLDQYHHSSHSPNQERRSSIAETSSPPTLLPPIRTSPTASNDHNGVIPLEEEQATTTEEHNTSLPTEEQEANNTGSIEDIKRSSEEREPSYTRDAPVTSQIRQPSPGPPPATIATDPRPSSPAPQVKAEPTATPRESSPATPATILQTDRSSFRAPSATPTVDAPTRKGIANLKEETAMKAPSTEASTPTRGTSIQSTAPKGASKKRAAPKSTSLGKKGTASTVRKPTPKKRKLDLDSNDGTPSSRRSDTPASRAGNTPRNRKASATPVASSPPPGLEEDEGDEDDGEAEDGDELFCICRRPDNHTWMIACDGGCEDWFHGKCVNIKEEDGDLIDKYICPNCEKLAKGNTTWKPMCRLPSCRAPARLTKKILSKYCSDDHGKEFMRLHTLKTQQAQAQNQAHGQSSGKKRRKHNYTDNDGNAGDEEEGSRGGVLKTGELAAVAKGVKDVAEFRTLGEGVLSPPPTISPDDDIEMLDADITAPKNTASKMLFTHEEDTRLMQIKERKADLVYKRAALRDRERFMGLVKERAKRVLDGLDGVKDICGFDNRISWSDEEFDQWRTCPAGQTAFSTSTLGPPLLLDTTANNMNNTNTEHEDADADEIATNKEASDSNSASAGVCQKRRCERHKQWSKIALETIRFEEAEARNEIRRLEDEGVGVRQRAKLRALVDEGGGDAGNRGNEDGEQSEGREDRVEGTGEEEG